MTGLYDLEEACLCSFSDDVVGFTDEFEERRDELTREVVGEGGVESRSERGEELESEFGESGSFSEHLYG